MAVKSLLVDALRAANEAQTRSGTDGSAPAPDAADASVPTSTDRAPAVDELELMETGETIERDEYDTAPGVAEDAEYAESIVLPTDAGFGSANDNLKTTVQELTRPGRSGDAARFERLAAWTPMLCLLLAVCAFGVFTAWSHLAGGEHGSELRMGLGPNYSPDKQQQDFVDSGLGQRFAFVDAAGHDDHDVPNDPADAVGSASQ